jgi:CheY-like chemotaxis protein
MTSNRNGPPSINPPSSRGRGTLPSRPATEPPLSPHGRGPTSLRATPRILVVDDSPICLDMMSLILEEGGYEVFTVGSPFALSSALTQHAPDLVLVDVNMPGLSGDKLVEITLRNRPGNRTCPIVLHSDKPDIELLALAESSGAAGYIRKTSDAEVVLREVRRFLGARR